MMIWRLGFCKAELVGVNAEKPDYFSKETHFWDSRKTADRVAEGGLSREKAVHAYMQLFPATDICHQGYVDATPILDWKAAPFTIEMAAPAWLRAQFRFVVVLREPIARDLSWYNHAKADNYLAGEGGCTASAFKDYEAYARCLLLRDETDTLWSGAYAPQLRLWTKVFPRKQMLVLAMDTLLADVQATVSIVADFLSTTFPAFDRDNDNPFPHANVHDTQDLVSCDIVSRLEAYYAPFNAELYEQLDFDRNTNITPPAEPPFPKFVPFACDVHRSNHTKTTTNNAFEDSS